MAWDSLPLRSWTLVFRGGFLLWSADKCLPRENGRSGNYTKDGLAILGKGRKCPETTETQARETASSFSHLTERKCDERVWAVLDSRRVNEESCSMGRNWAPDLTSAQGCKVQSLLKAEMVRDTLDWRHTPGTEHVR